MCKKDDDEKNDMFNFPEDIFPVDVFPEDIFPPDIFPGREKKEDGDTTD